ncbi:MAG: NFYB/HAP3 family transcription factor subunit [Candidatus Aenigmatarchaeota archaeon]
MFLTLQPLRRFFKKAGAKRVSDKAAEELGKILEAKAKDIILEAKRLSEYSGRRTVMKRDIKMAIKNLKE